MPPSWKTAHAGLPYHYFWRIGRPARAGRQGRVSRRTDYATNRRRVALARRFAHGVYPQGGLGVAQSYVVQFDQELFPNHVKLKRYDHRFTSANFQVSLADVEFHQDPKNPKLKKVIATLKFTHPVDSVDLEKRISMRLAGQKPDYSGSAAKVTDTPSPTTNSKARPTSTRRRLPFEKDTHMILAIDSGVRSERGGKPSDDKIERQIPIPGMHNYFRIQSANLALVRNQRFEPEQVLILQTTDGVEEGGLEKALQAYLLPRDLPAIQDRPAKRNIQYWNVKEIGPEVLALSAKVDLKPLPTDRQYATLHSFRYQSEPGRTLYIRIGKGLQSSGGYILAKDFDAALSVPAFPKELSIMYDGAILSLAGEKRCPWLPAMSKVSVLKLAACFPARSTI